MSPADRVPPSCRVAFKEWSGVCDALADGRQSLILRKGGIAEDGGRFSPEHPAFWLYPTRVHEAEQGLRVEQNSDMLIHDGHVPIRSLAVVDRIVRVDHYCVLEELASFHVWTDETVRKRFNYRSPGLWVLGVRVYSLPHAAQVAVTPDHAGCKTWVPLDDPPGTAGLAAALDAAEHGRRMCLLGAAAAAGQ